MGFLDAVTQVDPRLVWGLVSRGVGLVYFVSFASLASQVLPTAGKNGITPIAESLAAIERDFPTWKRFFWFPSVLWSSRSDALLGALPWMGMLASAGAVVGGAHAPWMFAVMYLAYLSLDRPMVLVYPWDCMLFEAGFWGMFLPGTLPLPSIAATLPPLPAVAWVFRLIVFRVLFGFGKHKFIGKTPEDAGFLKSFFVNQPLPNRLGWLQQKLPMSVHKLALALMFLVEIPLPFAVFLPGPWGGLAAIVIIGLMLGIWATGNFGYFNLGVIVLALAWLDPKTPWEFDPTALFATPGLGFIHALVGIHLFCAFACFPLNTFCAQTWMMWPFWRRTPWPFRVGAAIVRFFHPLRWAHPYGVFPPKTPPVAKVLPIIEATWDEETWHTIQHRFSATVETSPPRFCAPHHDRFDQATVYEGIGLCEASAMRNFMGRWDPYGHGGTPAALVLLDRMTRGSVPGRGFYDRALERRRGAPISVRARTFLFEPSTLAEARAGKWWVRTLIGPHFPAVHRDRPIWVRPLPHPELWHLDDIEWLRRSRIGPLMKRASRGESHHDLIRVGASEITESDCDAFWAEIVPEIQALRRDWSPIRSRVGALRERFGDERLYRFERIAARYAALLFAKLEPLFLDGGPRHLFGKGAATLDVKTSFHLRLLCQHVVTEGRERYDSICREPLLAREEVPSFTLQSGAVFQALFQYERLVYQSQKLRLFHDYDSRKGLSEPTPETRRKRDEQDAGLRRLFAVFDYGDFLRTQFTGAADVLDIEERWPEFELRPDGEVVRMKKGGASNSPH